MTKQEIVSTYLKILVNRKFIPSRADLKDCGINRDAIRHHFGNLSKLKAAAREENPEAFNALFGEEQMTWDLARETATLAKRYKRFVVTAVVNGCAVNQDFYKSLKTYAKKNKAMLLLVPCAAGGRQEWQFDPILRDERLVFSELKLNRNIRVSDINVGATQVHPETGLDSITQTEGSFIFGSPKQHLKYVPVSNEKLPHCLASTGAITTSRYHSANDLMVNRTNYISDKSHQIGAVVVEIENEEIYHLRHITANNDGSFADLGKLYAGKLVKDQVPVMVYGDWHVQETDEVAAAAFLRLTRQVKAKTGVFHDLFDGISINPHEEENILLRASRTRYRRSLQGELADVAETIEGLLENHLDQVIVVKSNHDLFLDRWLAKGKFDVENYELGLELSLAKLKGKDPLQAGVERWLPKAVRRQVRWLKLDEDYKVGGVLLSAHGHKGANGAKGSLRALSKAYGKAVIGHSHTPGLYRGIAQVGTTSKLKLAYNEGPSSWVHCSALVYPTGQVQLVNVIDGKYCLDDKVKNKLK